MLTTLLFNTCPTTIFTKTNKRKAHTVSNTRLRIRSLSKYNKKSSCRGVDQEIPDK